MPAAPSDRASARHQWYAQPVVWIAIAVFVMAIAGCISLVVLGARHADQPVAEVGEQLFKVPISRSSSAAAK